MKHTSRAVLLAAPILLVVPSLAEANPPRQCYSGFGCPTGFCLGLFSKLHQHGPLFNYGPYYGYPPFEPYGPWNPYLQYNPWADPYNWLYGRSQADAGRGFCHFHRCWSLGGWFQAHSLSCGLRGCCGHCSRVRTGCQLGCHSGAPLTGSCLAGCRLTSSRAGCASVSGCPAGSCATSAVPTGGDPAAGPSPSRAPAKSPRPAGSPADGSPAGSSRTADPQSRLGGWGQPWQTDGFYADLPTILPASAFDR